MKSLTSYPVKVVSAGFVVLLLLSMPLFWARFLSEGILRENMSSRARDIIIEPSGLVPKDIENDPNVAIHSQITGRMLGQDKPFTLGVADYFAARAPTGRRSNIYHYHYKNEHDYTILYLDENTGLFVYHRTHKQRLPDQTTVLRKIRLYAGPEGVSETPDKTLGRFIAPITDSGEGYRAVTLFDKKLRRFFSIDFKQKTVIKGPQLPKDDLHNPIQISFLAKNSSDTVQLLCSPPQMRVIIPSDETKNEEPRLRKPKVEFHTTVRFGVGSRRAPFVLVLDESGRIDLLDKQTLQFAATAGYLPAPEALFTPRPTPSPRDLLGYEVLPVTLGTDHQYKGLCTATICREGAAMAVAVFDEKGRSINNQYTNAGEQYDVPGGPALMIAKFLLENLHPPILSIASYFTADTFEAAAGHRALFILPNSFIAMIGREVTDELVNNFLFALLLISPSIILAIFLACRVAKDATLVGLSENAKLCWTITTMAFGLPAYITYRLTRPKITLVTCANCGRLRRPDMATCHRCGSKWLVPELTPPTWRVLDSIAEHGPTSAESPPSV